MNEPQRLTESELIAISQTMAGRQTDSLPDCSPIRPSGWQRDPPSEYKDLVERPNWPRLLERLRRNQWPVYFWGSNGNGKSYSAAMAYTCFRRPAKWLRYVDFINDAKSLQIHQEIVRWNGAGVCCEITLASYWRTLETVGLLVVDEIGIGDAAKWKSELFWKLLEVRKHRPLILTGNIKPIALVDQFDKAIRSRIMEGQMIEFASEDQRSSGVENRIARV